MSSTNVVSLPTSNGEPFLFENLLKINVEDDWQSRFHKMLQDALRPQLQNAIEYYGSLLASAVPPRGASRDEEHH